MTLDDAMLIPIDMQKAFDDKPWPPRWNGDADRNGEALLSAWRASRRPLLHVRHDSVQPGSTLRPGLPGHAFREGFVPRAGETIVAKHQNSAFVGTDLDERLKAAGAGSLVVFGISTDMCVSTTVRHGANLGWRMILVEDACDCFDLPGRDGRTIPARAVHEAHVASLAYEFCEIVTTSQVLAAMKNAQGPLPVAD